MKLAQYDEAVRALKKAIEIDETNLKAADLLEQAEAGKKRVDFGANQIKSKLPPLDRRTAERNQKSEKIERTAEAETVHGTGDEFSITVVS